MFHFASQDIVHWLHLHICQLCLFHIGCGLVCVRGIQRSLRRPTDVPHTGVLMFKHTFMNAYTPEQYRPPNPCRLTMWSNHKRLVKTGNANDQLAELNKRHQPERPLVHIFTYKRYSSQVRGNRLWGHNSLKVINDFVACNWLRTVRNYERCTKSNSVEQSHSCETAGRNLWNLMKHYPVHNTLPQDLILRQTNPDRILISLTSANTLGYSTIYASS
jgi:hypothetical protein